jgi:hypothetical protein
VAARSITMSPIFRFPICSVSRCWPSTHKADISGIKRTLADRLLAYRQEYPLDPFVTLCLILIAATFWFIDAGGNITD